MTSKKDTKRITLWVLALSVFGLTAAPAAADWLVLQDGERIETRGPWEAKGSRIQFTDTKGALVSMRANDVDLEASRLATQPKASPAPTAPPTSQTPAPRRAPVMVLDNTSIRQARPSAIAAANGETDAESPEAESNAELRVASFEEDRSFADGVRFRGVLENPSDNFAVLVSVRGVPQGHRRRGE